MSGEDRIRYDKSGYVRLSQDITF